MIDIKKTVLAAMPVYPDWPRSGVNYLNTVDICLDPRAFQASVDWFHDISMHSHISDIFAADARGFIWGSPVAYRRRLPLHVIRKKGKMPGELLGREYELEYGTDALELRKTDIKEDNRVLIIDDVLATGGTAEAMCHLVHDLGVPYKSMTVACLIGLSFLKGRDRLHDLGVQVETLVDIDE